MQVLTTKIKQFAIRIYETRVAKWLMSVLTRMLQGVISLRHFIALSSVFLSGVFIYEAHVNYFFTSEVNISVGILGVFIGISTMLYAIKLWYDRS